MKNFIRFTSLCTLLLLAAPMIAQDEPEPGDKIRQRTKKDVALLLPQVGPGGSPTSRVDGENGTPRQFKIESEGCEKMKGYVCVPPGLDKSRKYAMAFAFVRTFWGDGDTATDMLDIGVMTSARDPLIVCAIQYTVTKREGNVTHITEAADRETRRVGFAWALKKVMKEHPVDPERVFLTGVYHGTDEAINWATSLWAEDPDAFPFRAILIDGVVTESADSMPPVPLIITVDKGMDSHFRQAGSSDTPRMVVNHLMSMGIPCQFHLYEDKWTNYIGSGPVRTRWQVIMRDAMQCLGGPGALEYYDAKPPVGVITKDDELPFAESTDPVVAEVIGICKAGDWGRAQRRLKEVLENRSIKTSDKRPVLLFKREFDKYVKDEMDRCNKSIEVSLKAEAWAHSLHKARLASMWEAFKDEGWCRNKPYGANLEKLKTYPVAVREAARRDRVLEAVNLELTGEREKAKAKYEEIAKEKDADGGLSDWPRAAEYRLSWWTD